ncbi:MAG TPA: hypothetical protein VLX89_07880 [Actinomycetota bacterium]|nr:hypothetical protein [Actinomycetota bacterium]
MNSERRHVTLGIAAGGVLLGHWLTYLVVTPVASARAEELARTGHGYLSTANDLVIGLVLISAASIVIGRLVDRDRSVPSYGVLMPRLGAFQAGAFASMEVLERVFAGVPVAEALHHGILPVGVLVQLGVAALGTLAIRWLLRVADRLEALGTAPAHPRSAAFVDLLLPTSQVPSSRQRASFAIRGPPVPSATR